MSYLIFVLIGLVATVLGYGFGWTLDRWENTDRTKRDRSLLLALLTITSLALLTLSGLVFLLLQVWLLRFVAAGVLLLIGFRVGHPEAPKRLRQLTRTIQELTATIKD